MSRLWLEKLFRSFDELVTVFEALESNPDIQVENLDLGQTPSLASDQAVQAFISMLCG